MGIMEICHEARSEAAPERVWELLTDSVLWPSWTPIEQVEIEVPGADDGIGEIRTFTTGRVTVRERVVDKVAPRRYAYELLGGLAVRDYRADIDLRAEPDGSTVIRWHTRFRAKLPGMGGVYRRALDKATRRFVTGLARKAESPSA